MVEYYSRSFELMLPENGGEKRREDVVNKRRYEAACRSTDNESNGEIDDAATNEKLREPTS